jgi:hypothetical protein
MESSRPSTNPFLAVPSYSTPSLVAQAAPMEATMASRPPRPAFTMTDQPLISDDVSALPPPEYAPYDPNPPLSRISRNNGPTHVPPEPSSIRLSSNNGFAAPIHGSSDRLIPPGSDRRHSSRYQKRDSSPGHPHGSNTARIPNSLPVRPPPVRLQQRAPERYTSTARIFLETEDEFRADKRADNMMRRQRRKLISLLVVLLIAVIVAVVVGVWYNRHQSN